MKSALRSAAAICGLLATYLGVPGMAAEWSTPRTPDGKPDLQGIWSNATQTPLERPVEFGEKRALTLEEAQQREERARLSEARGDNPSDPNRLAPTDGNVGAAYNTFWLDRGTNVITINGEYRTSMIIDPPNGRIPWLPEADRTPNALARWLSDPDVDAFDGPELQTIGERCLLFFDFRTSNSSAGPPMMPLNYNNFYQIVQTPDYVVIMAEMVHDARIIRIDDAHGPAHVQKWMGDSVGHWESDTLVVTTRHLHPQQSHYGSSDAVLITERFTRESQEQIVYSFTMDDSSVYSAPWTAEMALRARPVGEKIYEYACHEGNYALQGILAGARVQERDAAQ